MTLYAGTDLHSNNNVVVVREYETGSMIPPWGTRSSFLGARIRVTDHYEKTAMRRELCRTVGVIMVETQTVFSPCLLHSRHSPESGARKRAWDSGDWRLTGARDGVSVAGRFAGPLSVVVVILKRADAPAAFAQRADGLDGGTGAGNGGDQRNVVHDGGGADSALG